MAFFERFVYKKTKSHVKEVGAECLQPLDPLTLIATRPFLNTERFGRRRRRGALDTPHVISIGDINYVVDGHHKARKAIDEGRETIECEVLFTASDHLARELEKANHGLLVELPIR